MNPIKGYVGLTDPGWYEYLCSRERVDEVNFWQPGGGQSFKALGQGDLFFFKLRAPLRAIAGFGFFERYEKLPAWLAWQCFKEMNGAATFEEMLERLHRLRRESDDSRFAGDFEIGCIMLSAPVFFREQEWVDPPADWARTGIQKGKAYDLRSGEGRRLMEECLLRARAADRKWNVDPEPQIAADDAQRYGSPMLVRPRLGQGLFSLAVRDAYDRACAVTKEHSLPVLEAAHILPYARGGKHVVENGLLLRSDLHRLFDSGYVTVTPDFRFRVGERLRGDFHNGRSYYGLDGAEITLPTDEALRPSRELLERHIQEVFKG